MTNTMLQAQVVDTKNISGAPSMSSAVPLAKRSSPNNAHPALAPVKIPGSFDHDRIIKSGEVLKRTGKTKSWKTVHIVLRPNRLSIYKDSDETKLRHQISLTELTAIARRKDPKRKDKHVFGLFSPSKNYYLEAANEHEAQEWVEVIRKEAHIDEEEGELQLMSPGGQSSTFQGFERMMGGRTKPNPPDVTGYSSSDIDAIYSPSVWVPKHRKRDTSVDIRPSYQPSHFEYSGAEHGSISDFSDVASPTNARMSALSLSYSEIRPASSSNPRAPAHVVYGPNSGRPSMASRNASQMSNINVPQEQAQPRLSASAHDQERVIHHGWIYLLKTTSGVRQWKKSWMVLRPKALALYKNDDEYTAQLILQLTSIIDVVEIDPISKSKTACMQIIGDERNYRLCALDEESLANWLGAFKSLLAKRRTAEPSSPMPVT